MFLTDHHWPLIPMSSALLLRCNLKSVFLAFFLILHFVGMSIITSTYAYIAFHSSLLMSRLNRASIDECLAQLCTMPSISLCRSLCLWLHGSWHRHCSIICHLISSLFSQLQCEPIPLDIQCIRALIITRVGDCNIIPRMYNSTIVRMIAFHCVEPTVYSVRHLPPPVSVSHALERVRGRIFKSSFSKSSH